MARRRRHHRREHEHEHQHKKAHKNVLPTIEPAPGAGGTTTNTTSSPADSSGGVTAAAGDLTGATTTAPVPQQESMDEIQAFFSSGTGPAQHYHQVPQQAESAEVQQTGASK